MKHVESTTLRHKVGQCPACREYLWAQVTVSTEVSEPTISPDGKCHAYVNAKPIAMCVSHQCQPGFEEQP
jgi:hypothetical protein